MLPHGERIPALVLRPADWRGDVAIWHHPLGKQGLFTPAGALVPDVRATLDHGMAVIAADLFGQGEATVAGRPLAENPGVHDPGRTVNEADRWRLDPAYFYCYNPSACARRMHDLMSLVVFARSGSGPGAKRVVLVGVDGAAHWVAGALAASAEGRRQGWDRHGPRCPAAGARGHRPRRDWGRGGGHSGDRVIAPAIWKLIEPWSNRPPRSSLFSDPTLHVIRPSRAAPFNRSSRIGVSAPGRDGSAHER